MRYTFPGNPAASPPVPADPWYNPDFPVLPPGGASQAARPYYLPPSNGGAPSADPGAAWNTMGLTYRGSVYSNPGFRDAAVQTIESTIDPSTNKPYGRVGGRVVPGLGYRYSDFPKPAVTMLLDEVGVANTYSSSPFQIWSGFAVSGPVSINFDGNEALGRHGGSANWLMLDGGVRTVDQYTAPTAVSYFPHGFKLQ
jgi:prepilin-type processing-associated H-X9-DG protein